MLILPLTPPPLPGHILFTNLVKQHSKNENGTRQRLRRHGMPKQNAGDTNRYHLPRGHDHRKHDRPKLLDRGINEKLPRCRRDGRDDVVLKDAWIDPKKLYDFGNIPIENQSRSRHDDRRTIHPQHHLIRIHVRPPVLDVNFILPLTREAIETNVHAHEEEADDFGGGVAVGAFARDAEDGHADGDEEGFDVLGGGIGGSLENFAHDHDGNDFGAFEDRLYREADVS